MFRFGVQLGFFPSVSSFCVFVFLASASLVAGAVVIDIKQFLPNPTYGHRFEKAEETVFGLL